MTSDSRTLSEALKIAYLLMTAAKLGLISRGQHNELVEELAWAKSAILLLHVEETVAHMKAHTAYLKRGGL